MGRFRVDRMCERVVAIRGPAGTVVSRCHVADRPLARLVGLLGTRDLAADEGLWLTRCGSVHTMGMGRAIACAFIDAQGRVLRVVDPMPPRRLARAAGAVAVLEAPAGTLRRLAPGAHLTWVGETPEPHSTMSENRVPGDENIRS